MLRRLRAYPDHPDPVTAACNRIALLVASSQPLYPFYVKWIVGGDWWVAFWTFLSTPCFAAVPWVARRNAKAGRMLLVATGIGNGIVSTKAFGTASAVEAFLLPCLLITALAFRRERKTLLALTIAIALAALLHGVYGPALGHFSTDQYRQFRNFNLYSVAVLSIAILWMLTRARSSSAPR